MNDAAFPIRGIIIPLGTDHDELRVVVHPRGGVNVERREGQAWIGRDNITVTDADLLAVLRRAGVLIEDLIHKLADVEQAEPTTCVPCPGCHARMCRVGEVCGVCSNG